MTEKHSLNQKEKAAFLFVIRAIKEASPFWGATKYKANSITSFGCRNVSTGDGH